MRYILESEDANVLINARQLKDFAKRLKLFKKNKHIKQTLIQKSNNIFHQRNHTNQKKGERLTISFESLNHYKINTMIQRYKDMTDLPNLNFHCCCNVFFLLLT